MTLEIGLLNGLSIGLTYVETDEKHVVLDIFVLRLILSWGEAARTSG
jgi:hypothetical protein